MTAFRDVPESDIQQYHAMSALAIIGLVMGLLSPLALLAPLFWVVPWATIPLCLLALPRVAEETPALAGRKAALIGLWVAVACGVAAPVDWSVYRWVIRGEARQFSTAFFDFLRKNEPHKAEQLYANPAVRHPFDEHLWDAYVNDWNRYQDMKDFVAIPAVRTLLALGDKAEVRYYDTESHEFANENQVLTQVYAVTFPGKQGKETFFVRLALKRIPFARSQESYWRVDRIDGGVQPVALGGVLKTG